MFNQGGAANNAKQGASGAAPGAGGRPSGGTSPPSSSVNQQAVQQQQPHPYGYGGPHPGAQYSFSTPFNLVNAHPHPAHPLQHQPNPTVGGGNLNPAAGGGAAGNAASSLIDPMLSTLSDGGEGMSEDEEHGASAGVKAGGTATGGGNNGINQHHLEDEDFHGDGSQGGPGGVSLGVATALDENGQPIKKKRRRQALSCTECKRRKIKCDRQNPCSPCTRRGEADRCRWATQEPIPDSISAYPNNEKYVTRQEYELLQQKVIQLEAMVANLAPRAFLPGLDPLNLPMGPPFPFGPPPHHGAPTPQHHPYPGPSGQQQQPGAPQDGQFPPGAGGQAQTAQEMHQLYQQHLAYAAAAAAHNAQAQAQAAATAAAAAGAQQPVDKAGDAQMEVDQTHAPVQQHATGGTDHTAEARGTPPALHETTGKLIPASPSASSKVPKSKKRKERAEGEDAGDETAGRGGGASNKGRGKPRSQKQQGWDTNGSPLLSQDQATIEPGEPSATAS